MSDNYDLFDRFDRRMENIDAYHRRQEADFDRLLVEPCMTMPVVGDRVIVAAGLLGRGFNWVRREVEVVALADASVQIRWPGRDGGGLEWIHPALITDVLKREAV